MYSKGLPHSKCSINVRYHHYCFTLLKLGTLSSESTALIFLLNSDDNNDPNNAKIDQTLLRDQALFRGLLNTTLSNGFPLPKRK